MKGTVIHILSPMNSQWHFRIKWWGKKKTFERNKGLSFRTSFHRCLTEEKVPDRRHQLVCANTPFFYSQKTNAIISTACPVLLPLHVRLHSPLISHPSLSSKFPSHKRTSIPLYTADAASPMKKPHEVD